MPHLDPEQIKDHIAKNQFLAITVDTSIVDKFGSNLDHKIIKALDQFQHGTIKVLISEIVEKEIKSHIASSAEITRKAVNKSLQDHAKRWQFEFDNEKIEKELSLNSDPKETANLQFDKFLSSVKGEIVPALNASTNDLIKRYFENKPPFEENAKKKNEFPDAFALLSLESAAKNGKNLILCISSDQGWKKFCDSSDFLVCIDDLELALSYFNESGRKTADHILALWQAGNAKELDAMIEREFENQLEGLYFLADGTAPVGFEGNSEGAVLETFSIMEGGGPVVIETSKDQVVFTITVNATVRFFASFDFYATDSFDRDEVHLSSQFYETKQNIDAGLAITVLRETDEDPEPEVSDVEVYIDVSEVNFGFIEPFPHEDPTHEKY
ncbi:PIN domain-containing protein [Thalassospira sp.]|uniref:PIN domain-containing protein n=1 Tax=Thalassospira sp. TaxID=1912094 RepID=UPI002624EC1D|nr:PIN domain-containing protein [Thalassospira sp.]MCH2276002.1 PIN domain-containing protein [Thalassospira sp.]